MESSILDALMEARRSGEGCALVTVAAVKGSVPREAGAKMLVFAEGRAVGTVGGGKFEALVVQEALSAIEQGDVRLRTFPLREGEPDSFGAICGGDVTVLIEPQRAGPQMVVVGAGHCARALTEAASRCGFRVIVVDDRGGEMEKLGTACQRVAVPFSEFGPSRIWGKSDALVLVSRNFEIDRKALETALGLHESAFGYIGMIGSRRKVLRVFDELREQGVPDESLARVYAPIGLDIGADSPEEIAVSVLAEVLQVLRGAKGGHLKG